MQLFHALIFRFSNPAAHDVVSRMLKAIPVEFMTSITDVRHTYDELPEDKHEWFCSSDIRGCKYDSVDWNSLIPLDEELIESMRDCESVFMHMVSRTEVARLVPYQERKRQYLKHLRFWNDYIERNAINIYISAWMPHEVPDYIIFRLCELKNIPTLVFHITSLKNYMYLMENVLEYDPQLGKSYAKLLKTYAHKTPNDVQVCRQFQEYFDQQCTKEGKMPFTEWPAPPFFLIRWANIFVKDSLGTMHFIMRYIAGLFSLKKWLRRFQKWKCTQTTRRLSAFYSMHAIQPDFSQKFVYVPLHYQPEATTCPMAGAFVDQLVSISLLAKHIPEDVLLYVKEHPKQAARGHACRTFQYYTDLLALKNVRLIDIASDSFALREHCTAIATSAGTAGFEAIFRGKPVFMFGHYFYQYAPGVYPISTEEDCRVACHDIFVDQKKPSPLECKIFLKAVEETAVRAALCNHHQSVCDLSHEEIATNASKVLIERIKALS